MWCDWLSVVKVRLQSYEVCVCFMLLQLNFDPLQLRLQKNTTFRFYVSLLVKNGWHILRAYNALCRLYLRDISLVILAIGLRSLHGSSSIRNAFYDDFLLFIRDSFRVVGFIYRFADGETESAYLVFRFLLLQTTRFCLTGGGAGRCWGWLVGGGRATIPLVVGPQLPLDNFDGSCCWCWSCCCCCWNCPGSCCACYQW